MTRRQGQERNEAWYFLLRLLRDWPASIPTEIHMKKNTTATPTGTGAPDLLQEIRQRPPREAAERLRGVPPATAADILARINPAVAQDILPELSPEQRAAIMAAAPKALALQWSQNQSCPEDSVGRMMEPPIAVFGPELTVGEAVDQLRDLVKTALVTYSYVTDGQGRLVGVVTMRDLLFANRDQQLADVMLQDVFALRPETPLLEAMRQVVNRHFPVYPVCNDAGILVGLVRGQAMFEHQAFEISAQAGSMVGVEKEERVATPLSRSFKYRHPWLQLNLLTAFLAGGVVGVFQGTIDQLVILAMFLPVLAGQSGNTGCQALAVTLRGMTLGELKPGAERRMVMKEASLGFFNGALTGLVAGIGMYVVATGQASPHALMLSLAVFLAMIGSCVISGVFGALTPVTLRRMGADPATASSIFLTTATDIASMGMLLGMATLLVL